MNIKRFFGQEWQSDPVVADDDGWNASRPRPALTIGVKEFQDQGANR